MTGGTMYGSLQATSSRRRWPACASTAPTSSERVMTTPQGAHVEVEGRGELLNLCANNYLGLADHPAVVAAAHAALDRWGLRPGLGALHLRHAGAPQGARGAARRRSSAPRTRSSTPRASTPTAASSRRCSARRTRSSPTQLNHASIIDGIRLCKAQRLRYANGDMDELEARLKEAAGRAPPADRHRRRLLDGRLPRASSTGSATWPSATTRW